MAQPACEPPEARRKLAALRIVGNDLRIVIDAPDAKCLDQIVAARQRVTSIEPGLRAGQLRIDVCKHGARNVTFPISANAGFGVEQVVAHVHDAPTHIVQVPAQLLDGQPACLRIRRRSSREF